jgi:hypothetical protein
MSINPAEIPKAFKADLDGALKHKKNILGKAYSESLDALNVKVDTNKIEEPLLDLLTEYEKRAEKAVPGFKQALETQGKASAGLVDATGEALEQSVEVAKESLNKIEVQNYLHLKDAIEPYLKRGEVLEGKGIVQYLDNLNDLTKIRKNVNVQGMSKVDQDLIRVAKQAAGTVDEGLDETLEGQAFKNIKQQYKQVYKDDELVKRYMKDDAAVNRVLQNFDSPAQDVRADDLRDLAKRYNLDIDNAANDAFFIREFGNRAAVAPKYVGGTSPNQRTVPLAIGAGALGWYAGQQSGASPYLSSAAAGALGALSGSPAAIRNYTKIGRRMRQGTGALAPAAAPAAGVYQQLNQIDRFPREK